MADLIKEWLVKILKSRLFVVWVLVVVLFVVALQRLFTLQVIRGEEYLNDYTMSIQREITVEGARGNIYDRNGILLAHNELSYTITMVNDGTLDNEELNAEISKLIDMIEKNGDTIINDLDLYMDPVTEELSFLVDGTNLMGFRRDIFGKKSVSELEVNKKFGFDEAQATPEQVYEYLISADGRNYDIDEETYGRYRAYQIAVVRYALSLNSFQRYIATDIAADVSDATVAMIEEHLYELPGVDVQEDSKRVYDYPEYFSHIIGYTGKISDEEYEELSAEDDSYTTNDMVGKSGIEQVMETQLQGKKGYRKVYVNNVGKVLEVAETTDPAAGNDVYLSIDAKLQCAVYDLLEQELAGILNAQIVNSKYADTNRSIPIYDVYNALIENDVIDIDQMASAPEDTYQSRVYDTYAGNQQRILQSVQSALNSDTAFENQSEEMQEYLTYIVTYLQDQGVFDTTDVDSSDQVYTNWRNGTVSVKEYLQHAIDSSWIQVSALNLEEQYADTEEIYAALVSYIMEKISASNTFQRLIYKSLIYSDMISGSQLCVILYEQGVLEYDEGTVNALKNGSTGAYSFLKEKIRTLEITPAQLALDPCTGSCVIMDPNNGNLLACVTYPGYDTNRLANNMDSEYWNSLVVDGSNPLYNNATQQTTAPGSTFKLVMATAGLTEGVISPSTQIHDPGYFDRLDYFLRCWIYPSAHGNETVTTAIRDSCNTFFCEIGYRLSLVGDTFREDVGLEKIQEYAGMYGLGDKTGLEIPEMQSKIADEYPVSASIGQSNNNYTTVALARYVSAVANEGTVYDLTLLDHVADSDGNVLERYKPQVKNTIDEVSSNTWSLIKQGMRMVVEDHAQFDDLQTPLSGKTGTAQEDEDRPDHGLFVGFAPSDNPQIAIATRIAFGYGSGNACDFADTVMKYYFQEASEEELLNGQAANVGTSSGGFAD